MALLVYVNISSSMICSILLLDSSRGYIRGPGGLFVFLFSGRQVCVTTIAVCIMEGGIGGGGRGGGGGEAYFLLFFFFHDLTTFLLYFSFVIVLLDREKTGVFICTFSVVLFTFFLLLLFPVASFSIALFFFFFFCSPVVLYARCCGTPCFLCNIRPRWPQHRKQ